MSIYKRILLKFSGEMLSGESGFGIDNNVVKQLINCIQPALKSGVEIALVTGGGNFLRGTSLVATGSKQANADQIGMLATVMNAIAIYDELEQQNIRSIVMSAYGIDNGICQNINYGKAHKFLSKKGVVIFCAGTGNPLVSTDTAAALRGVEIGADLLIKATKVDGVYDSDPLQNKDAKRYNTLSFDTALKKNLQIMDTCAFTLCKTHKLPIAVLNLMDNEKHFTQLLNGDSIGTMVKKL